MMMDVDACYRALSTRDCRFDGRLFVAVKTTGIYCRPICPAQTPKRQNVIFYPSAAAAQQLPVSGLAFGAARKLRRNSQYGAARPTRFPARCR